MTEEYESTNPLSLLLLLLLLQYCTEIFQIFGQEGGETDIFWNAPWDAEEAAENCATMYWGEEPRQEFIYESYGDIEEWARATSNIVWSNGELDPWRGGGGGTEPQRESVERGCAQSGPSRGFVFCQRGGHGGDFGREGVRKRADAGVGGEQEKLNCVVL